MKEPVDHIARPNLPWRDPAGMTECGHDAAKVPTITREQYLQRLKDMGQQRTAMFTCMTCATTAGRWSDWEADPRQALGREIDWERGSGYRSRTDRGQQLKDELVAIAALIEKHRDEFDAIISENGQRREWLERKAAKANADRKPKPRPLGIL
jgi:hypothetical protein